ncbi:hypothetical protein QL093DRAFT_2398872 [Fusarium oxysporum]|nr:hypothetical protein QL093DRAFT_2398872 [Fusarium oxysporum]
MPATQGQSQSGPLIWSSLLILPLQCSGQSPCRNCLGRGAECSYQDPSNGSSKRKRKQALSNTNQRLVVT